jgi:serine/threonine protein kinase
MVINGSPAGTFPGGLRVLGELGQTAEGSLYRAEYPNGLEVALVILGSAEHPADPAMRARLREWFERAIRIEHPNVAAVHEMGETEEGLVYLVAECLTGELLSESLVERGALPLEEVLDVCRQAAAGLQAAHEVGCFHGNLSPDTILLTAALGGLPQVKLIHFAQPSSSEVSPEFASPERIAGYRPDERSDVFSLAAVLHHLIARVPPGVESGAGVILQALRAAVGEAMSTEPEQRFQTIPEFAASVERAAAAETRISTPGRARVLGAAAAALALVVTGLRVLPSSQPSAESSALRVSGAATRALDEAEMATHQAAVPPSLSAPRPAAKRASSPPPARREAPHTVSTLPAAASPADKPGEKRRLPPATEAGPVSAAAAASADHSIDTSLTPAPAPTPPTPEMRAQVYLRIGLDEAAHQLGGPVHAIEGMSPMFIGLAQGQVSPGADSTRPVVRAVYLDPSGGLILLDQQRIQAGQRVPPTTRDRWPIGNVLVSLHGEVPPQTIGNLRARVR